MDLKEYQELVDNKQKEVNQALRSLEDIDHRLGLIHSDTKVCLSTETEDNRIVTIKVSDIIPENVLSDLFDKTVAEMKHARADIERRLDKALGIERKPAIPNPVFEEAIKDMVKPTQKVENNTSNKGVTIEQIQELLDKGLNQKQIAVQLGITQPSVNWRIKKYNLVAHIKNSKKEEKGELRSLVSVSSDDKEAIYAFLSKKIPEIKALYTNGPFDLKKLAVEYACDKKVLHEFLAKNGLLKPSKNDPFKGK